MSIPQRVNNKQDQHSIEVIWSDDHQWLYPAAYLRRQCECAVCVHEITGERLLDPESISEETIAEEMKLIGNYALKFVWSDGHSSGLYTWDRLLALCQCDACTSV
jgi:DUF971 family protein